jgi:hypothetical protein
MTDQMIPEDPQDLWQNQEREEMTLTLAEVHIRARRLHRHARVATIVSLAGLLALLIVPIVVAVNRPGPIPRAIWAVAMLLLLYPNYRAYKAGRTALGETGTTASVEFYRRELERRARAPRTIIFVLVSLMAGVVVLQSGRPLKSWIPFFVIMAIWAFSYQYTRRHEIQEIKADLKELNRLTAKEL